MIVDTSALVAIVFREPGHERLLQALIDARGGGMGAPSLAEAGLVLGVRLERDAAPLVSRLVEELGISPVPFGERHWGEAVRAHRLYGRGRHPARLNFGDCLSYAVAKLAAQPLLFVGNGFTQTDLTAA